MNIIDLHKIIAGEKLVAGVLTMVFRYDSVSQQWNDATVYCFLSDHWKILRAILDNHPDVNSK